jgi:hypothetical protein
MATSGIALERRLELRSIDSIRDSVYMGRGKGGDLRHP